MIRLALVNDARAIANLHAESWGEAYPQSSPISLDHSERLWKKMIEDEVCTIAIISSVPVRFLHSRKTSTAIELTDLFVTPTHRRRGLAAGLFAFAIEAWKDAPDRWELSVDRVNLPARSLYDRLGFRETGASTRFERSGTRREMLRYVRDRTAMVPAGKGVHQ